MNIAVSGKGGSGKTTVACLLAAALKRKYSRVFIIDMDSDPHIHLSLGMSKSEVRPLLTLSDFIEEKTGARGVPGEFFVLNPDVSDLEKYAVQPEPGIFLLTVGTIGEAGAGCFCPRTAVARAILNHYFRKETDPVIVDLEAGLEWIGRGVADVLDSLFIVYEPGLKSVITARRIAGLAREAGIRRITRVLNRKRPGESFSSEINPDLVIPEMECIRQADMSGATIIPCFDSQLLDRVQELLFSSQDRSASR